MQKFNHGFKSGCFTCRKVNGCLSLNFLCILFGYVFFLILDHVLLPGTLQSKRKVRVMDSEFIILAKGQCNRNNIKLVEQMDILSKSII